MSYLEDIVSFFAVEECLSIRSRVLKTVPKMEMQIPKKTKHQFFTLIKTWQPSRTAISKSAGVIKDNEAMQIAPESAINKSKSGTRRASPSEIRVNHK